MKAVEKTNKLVLETSIKQADLWPHWLISILTNQNTGEIVSPHVLLLIIKQ